MSVISPTTNLTRVKDLNMTVKFAPGEKNGYRLCHERTKANVHAVSI